MLSLDYKVPSYVSQSARDLLKRLLTNSPDKRSTVDEVMHHPWYIEGLPPSALNMNQVYLRNTADTNAQSVEEAARIVEEAMKHPDDLRTTTTPEDSTDDLIAQALEEEYDD